jgi:hypothetical protein
MFERAKTSRALDFTAAMIDMNRLEYVIRYRISFCAFCSVPRNIVMRRGGGVLHFVHKRPALWLHPVGPELGFKSTQASVALSITLALAVALTFCLISLCTDLVSSARQLVDTSVSGIAFITAPLNSIGKGHKPVQKLFNIVTKFMAA